MVDDAHPRSSNNVCARWPSPLDGRIRSMPDIRPFRGVRYDMAHVGALADVIAPPYDVIDPPLQDKLYDASPYNIIRLELNREEPGDTPGADRYSRAARFLKEWTRDGVLREDSQPAFYLYHQTFEVEGLDAPEVGRRAAAQGLVLAELTPRRLSLEDAFMQVTRGSVEFATVEEVARRASPRAAC